MKAILAVIGFAVLGVIGATQSPQITTLFQGQGQTMTHQELFQKTVDAFQDVPFLQWVPCTINADYKYSTCFVRDEGQGQNELNALLPKLLEQRGLQLSGIESGESTSGGAVTAPGLNRFRVAVTINEYDVSLLMYDGGLLVGRDPNKPYFESEDAYKSLREASRNIAARLVGSTEAVQQRINCNPPSEHAYCVTTKASSKTILDAISNQFNFTGRKIMRAGYTTGEFDVQRKDDSDGFLFVKIAYQRTKNVDEYTLWLVDYKRKNFKITYTPSSSAGKNVLRVKASWVDGYTPSPEEK